MKNIFDFNVHLLIKNSNNIDKTIFEDQNLKENELIKGLNFYNKYLKSLKGFNLFLFNTSIFDLDVVNFKNELLQFEETHISALLDFRRPDIFDYINCLEENKIDSVMVNSYLQKIENKDFPRVLEVFKYCESKKIKIFIDGSYGTSKMLKYNNLSLMCFIIEKIKKVPIVIIHLGGLRVKEVMLLALENDNIFLDTSFSLPFYMGSSIEKDFAFAFKKIGTKRIFYGSDNPYMDPKKTINEHLQFFKKYKFSDLEIENILCQNAINFFKY